MHGIIYQYTNTLKGLVYVGQTMQPAKRRRDYAKDVASTRPNPRYIIQAMQRDGLKAFTYQILAEATTADELTRLEIHYIAMLHANDPRCGYNRTTGGQCGPVGLVHSAEVRAKISLSNRSRIVSDETRAKMSQAHRGRGRGRICSAETRAKISLAKRAISDETRAKMSQAKRGKIGRTHSDETKAKIGLASRGRGLGRIVSDETRAKLSLAARGRTHSDEHTAKIAQANRGKTRSDEAKAKMSLAARRRAIKKITPVVHMCVEEGQA